MPHFENKSFQSKNTTKFCPDEIYKWNGIDAFDDKEESDLFVKEIINYASKNLALVTIYIREPFTEKIVIDREITPFSFVSDIGGLMGLFMGFSLVSMVEVIYHSIRVSFILISKIFKKSQETPRKSKSLEVSQIFTRN